MTMLLDWADEVLDAKAVEQLQEIVQRARHSEHILVLFSGAGARFAAALVAHAAGKELCRIDLSGAHPARGKKAVLLLDATGSNDRAANQQIAYLLQRLEGFPGLVILATDLRARMDAAFARRFQAVVRFKAPASSRAKRGPRSPRAKTRARSSPGRSRSRAASRPRK